MCNSILDCQSGFRSFHSFTATELLHLSDTVLRGLDSGLLTSLIALDFLRVFDIIDHELLLLKLLPSDLSCSALSFLRSFLTNRSQRVFFFNVYFKLSPFTM